MRRVARELVVLAVRGEATSSIDLSSARVAADHRFALAVDPTVDCDGSAFYDDLRGCIREIRATTDTMRRDARSARIAAQPVAGDLSHMSQLERDYHRELRTMFAAR